MAKDDPRTKCILSAYRKVSSQPGGVLFNTFFDYRDSNSVHCVAESTASWSDCFKQLETALHTTDLPTMRILTASTHCEEILQSFSFIAKMMSVFGSRSKDAAYMPKGVLWYLLESRNFLDKNEREPFSRQLDSGLENQSTLRLILPSEREYRLLITDPAAERVRIRQISSIPQREFSIPPQSTIAVRTLQN